MMPKPPIGEEDGGSLEKLVRNEGLRHAGLTLAMLKLSMTGLIPGSDYSINFCPRTVKAFTGDVFSYLFKKGGVYPCTTCKKDVPFRFVYFTALLWHIHKCSHLS
jgi:hypothetical protein